MSTLKVTHLQNENGTGPAMSIAVGGGVTFAGITTFHGALDLQTPTDLRVAAGATIGGSTNVITASTNGEERVRVTSGGNVGINRIDPDQKLNVNGNIEVNAYDSPSGAGGYYTAKGLIIGNAYDAGKTANVTDDRNAIIWQERGLDLDIATSDILRMKITYDGKVGIKTTNPDESLEVGDGTVSGGLKVSGQSSSVTSDGLTVDWESSTDSTRLFSEPQSGGSSQFKIYTTSSGTRNLAATINSSGNLAFPNGQGIDFSATAGSGIITNGGILDDYEEGTWTPELADATTGGNVATGTINGRYIKIGSQVTISMDLTNINTSGLTGGNAIFIRNLPYTIQNYSGAIRYTGASAHSNITMSGNYTSIALLVQDNNAYLRLLQMSTSSSDAASNVTVSQLASGTADIRGSVVYSIA